MIEMGVALTWDIRVLPIKAEGCPKPPSDISGQTWAEYQNSASEFLELDHQQKLYRMVKEPLERKVDHDVLFFQYEISTKKNK